VIDAQTGRVRQAGATQDEGAWVLERRALAEQSLYYFAKVILGRRYLSARLHRQVADWLQRVPPQRKMLLLPREHAKTSLVSHALPLHILIQPQDANVYFPGEDGCEQRVVLAGETERRAMGNLHVVMSALEGNSLLRAFWPHRVWNNSRREAPSWNDRACTIRRAQEYPEPSILAIGVGGAITGLHPSVLIKDDLATLDAMNSELVMQEAITWHITSRALINRTNALEFIIGTRWTVSDIYAYILEFDPSVEHLIRAAVEEGKLIYPAEELPLEERDKGFTVEKIAQLRKEFGVLFPLLYMNAANDPELTDFNEADLRSFSLDSEQLTFGEDERDTLLHRRLFAPKPPEPMPDLRGMPLRDAYDLLAQRRQFLQRVRVG